MKKKLITLFQHKNVTKNLTHKILGNIGSNTCPFRKTPNKNHENTYISRIIAKQIINNYLK